MIVRAAERADARSILVLLAARDVADIGRADVSADDVAADLERPETDVLVAEADGELLGVAVLDDGGAMVSVHPEREGRGAGTALRTAVEARGLPVRQAIAATNTAARAHLSAAGYVRESEHPRLRGPLGATLRADPRVERFDLDADGPEVEAVLAEGLPSLGRGLDRAGEPAFRLCVRDPDGIAGAVVGERWEDGVGYVAALAVRPRAQGRGYGRALVETLLVAFRDAGLTTGELSVHAANARAIALYESLGLVEDFRQERWVRA